MSVEIFINKKKWTILGRQINFLQNIIDVEITDRNQKLIVTVNGIPIPPMEWEYYKLKNSDSIFIGYNNETGRNFCKSVL